MTTIPTFLVVGAARCGTTGLVEGLRSHPRVFVTDPKEPHYFALHRIGAHFTAPGDEHTINKVAVTDRDAYLALYPQEHDFLALGDGSVSTIYYHQESIPEIKAINPDMRLVVMLREPVRKVGVGEDEQGPVGDAQSSGAAADLAERLLARDV